MTASAVYLGGIAGHPAPPPALDTLARAGRGGAATPPPRLAGAAGAPPPADDRGPEAAPVARYLCDVAAASLPWPLGDRRLVDRLHRLRVPTLTMWGDQDELLPVAAASAWSDRGVPVEVVVGAGHLLEWDAPG